MVGVLSITDCPEQIRLGCDILVAAPGSAPDVAVNTYGALDPQALFAVTDTDALPVPAVSVIARVELVPLHPVPLTDHVYEVAPTTAAEVYMAVAPAHGAVGNVTVVGAAGTEVIGVANT